MSSPLYNSPRANFMLDMKMSCLYIGGSQPRERRGLSQEDTFGHVWKQFQLSGKGCSWNLMVRLQGHCSAPYSAQDSFFVPTLTINDPAQNSLSAEDLVEKSCSTLPRWNPARRGVMVLHISATINERQAMGY
jgi:hypothetical protein